MYQNKIKIQTKKQIIKEIFNKKYNNIENNNLFIYKD
jgi:hypothetical protein